MVPWSLIVWVAGWKAARIALPIACIVGLGDVGASASPVDRRAAEIVLQRGAAVEVLAAAYSPDGRIIAASGESDTIRL